MIIDPGRGEPLGVICRHCGGDLWTKRLREGHGRIRECLLCSRQRGREGQQRRRRALPTTAMWARARDRAARSGVRFTITRDDVLRIWPADGCCPVFGTVLVIGRRRSTPNSPALDRINPAWGYEPGNIVVMSQRANLLKSNATAIELQKVAQWMQTNGLA